MYEEHQEDYFVEENEQNQPLCLACDAKLTDFGILVCLACLHDQCEKFAAEPFKDEK